MMTDKKTPPLWAWIAIGIVTLLTLLIFTTKFDPAPLPGEVAASLKRNKAILYIKSSEEESSNQTSEFGQWARDITIVDCEFETEKCEKDEIKTYPTWTIPALGLELVGSQSPKELKDLLLKLQIW